MDFILKTVRGTSYDKTNISGEHFTDQDIHPSHDLFRLQKSGYVFLVGARKVLDGQNGRSGQLVYIAVHNKQKGIEYTEKYFETYDGSCSVDVLDKVTLEAKAVVEAFIRSLPQMTAIEAAIQKWDTLVNPSHSYLGNETQLYSWAKAQSLAGEEVVRAHQNKEESDNVYTDEEWQNMAELFNAITGEDVDKCKGLIEKHTPLNVCVMHGNTIVRRFVNAWYCADPVKNQLCNLLIDGGADLLHEAYSSFSLGHKVMKYGNLKTQTHYIDALERAGQINYTDKKGNNIYSVALKTQGGNSQLLEYIKEKMEADIDHG